MVWSNGHVGFHMWFSNVAFTRRVALPYIKAAPEAQIVLNGSRQSHAFGFAQQFLFV